MGVEGCAAASPGARSQAVTGFFDHEVWHILVLAAALLGGASLVILLLGPLLSESFTDDGRSRKVCRAFVAAGIVMVAAEWWLIH